MHDHARFHSHFKSYPDEKQAPDVSWQVQVPPSVKLLANVLADLVYNKKYDGTLKNALKNRKLPDEVATYRDIADDLEPAIDAVKAEPTATSWQGELRDVPWTDRRLPLRWSTCFRRFPSLRRL